MSCRQRSVIFILLVGLHYCLIEAKSSGFFNTPQHQTESQFYKHLIDVLQRDQQHWDNLRKAPKPTEVEDWPKDPRLKNLGDVAGVAVDQNGNVHIFHRGNIVWDFGSFDYNNIYLQRDKGPISNDTIIIYNPQSGKIETWGRNRFYMPHGITLDDHGNTWVTDVALHQVMKFVPGKEEPTLVLGEAFVPGSDDSHFCKPTDVQVLSSGNFLVSDGYCNSRVLMFSPEGRLLKEFGTKDGMLVVHSITLLNNQSMVCVADRENGRVLCYTTGSDGAPAGILKRKLQDPEMGRLFAIDSLGDILLGVTGPSSTRAQGLTYDLQRKHLQNTWEPLEGFDNPHDMAVSHKENAVYVTEIGHQARKRIYKFQL